MAATPSAIPCDFGWTAVWASEMGDLDTRNGLLGHADRFMNPTWRDAGLYYPRNDAEAGEEVILRWDEQPRVFTLRPEP